MLWSWFFCLNGTSLNASMLSGQFSGPRARIYIYFFACRWNLVPSAQSLRFPLLLSAIHATQKYSVYRIWAYALSSVLLMSLWVTGDFSNTRGTELSLILTDHATQTVLRYISQVWSWYCYISRFDSSENEDGLSMKMQLSVWRYCFCCNFADRQAKTSSFSTVSGTSAEQNICPLRRNSDNQ